MRKRFRVLILAAIVAAVVVPVGFALSLEPAATWPVTPAPAHAMIATNVAPIVLDLRHQTAALASLPFQARVPESASLFVLGTLLIGLAIAVRRAV